MPIQDAARRVLAVRLGAVRDRLSVTEANAADSVEHVHQLRVGTRRAAAALRIFREFLPARLHRRTRRVLRRIRRAAAAARDWDVFLEALRARAPRAHTAQRRGLAFLIGFGQGQSAAARSLLQEAVPRLLNSIERRTIAVDAALQELDPGNVTLRDVAIPALTQLVEEFEAAAHGNLDAYDALHQVRIKGKQLRYALEVFESCFARGLRHDFYPRVAEMQEILGLANDSHVAIGRLAELQAQLEGAQPSEWKAYHAAFAALIRYHERRLPRQRRAFLRWWRTWEQNGAAATLSLLSQQALCLIKGRDADKSAAAEHRQ
jgi:CHAD domain-containing protein